MSSLLRYLWYEVCSKNRLQGLTLTGCWVKVNLIVRCVLCSVQLEEVGGVAFVCEK